MAGFNLIYQNDKYILGEAEGKYFLMIDEQKYLISDHPYEPCLYIKGPSAKLVTIHHAFTVDELCAIAKTNGTIKMVSGNEYDIAGVLKLINKAVSLSMDAMDISYVEGQCFMQYMKEHGAISPETAVSPREAGLENAPMYSFIHSKKAGKTPDGLCYLITNDKSTPKTGERFSRVISKQVVFGYGYRNFEGKRQFYAWHGYPNRNDDFITTAEISEAEFDEIEKNYPHELIADREEAEIFRNRYVAGHHVLLEGWNRLL